VGHKEVLVTHLSKIMLEELRGRKSLGRKSLGRKSLRLCLARLRIRWFDVVAEAPELPNHSPST